MDGFSDDDLKKAINNFLWSYLPGNTTLQEADGIACDLFDRLREMWAKAKTADEAGPVARESLDSGRYA